MLRCRPLRLLPLLLGPVAAALVHAGPPPAWLLADAAEPRTEQPPEVPAVILREEVVFEFNAKGDLTERRRGSIRVLAKGGEDFARAEIHYMQRTETVDTLSAWLVRGGKLGKAFGSRDCLDRAQMGQEALYSDFRLRGIYAASDTVVGDVFGYEIVVKRRTPGSQVAESFGGYLPVRSAAMEVRTPPGWTRRYTALRGPAITPQQDDPTVWRAAFRDLPFMPDEPWAAPPDTVLVAVDVQPPPGSIKGHPDWTSWGGVAAWLRVLQESQADSSPALSQAAQKVVRDQPDLRARVGAIARYVQEWRYAQSYRNTGLGFGAKPHRASEVLACGYGDCKDKVTLLISLLREIGVRAHLVGVYSGNPDAVAANWPSPWQFNHAIAAIEVPADFPDHSVQEVPGLGRVMFFDPTARWVPFGRLPSYLQKSRGLIVHPSTTALVTLPSISDDENWSSHATTRLTLDARGGLSGSSEITFGGTFAEIDRNNRFDLTDKEQREGWARKFNRVIRGITLQTLKTEDDWDNDRTTTRVEFTAPTFGQPVHEQLLVALDVLSRNSVPAFPEKTRRRPLEVRPINDSDEVHLVLPANFSVVELPPAKAVTGAFGSYEGRFEATGNAVVYRRRLNLTPRLVSVGEYPAFREFLIQIAKAERTSVVLRRR